MMPLILRLLGGRAVHKAVANHVEGSAFDPKLGFAMLRDGRVPFRSKLGAVGAACAIVVLLLAVEFPLEAILGVFVPILGLPIDAFVDGLEAIIGPVLFASLILPHFAPKWLSHQIRAERHELLRDPTHIDEVDDVIDVESYVPQPRRYGNNRPQEANVLRR